MLGGDEVLAAFVAGAVLNNGNRDDKVEEHHERFSEALGRLFDLPVMIVFGAAIPWAAWIGLGWWGAAFAAGILLPRRPPAWLQLGRLTPWTRTLPSTLFAGWFGPIGAAALFYAMLVQDDGLGRGLASSASRSARPCSPTASPVRRSPGHSDGRFRPPLREHPAKTRLQCRTMPSDPDTSPI